MPTIGRRAALMSRLLAEAPQCRVIPPEGGMFVLLDVRGTGLGSFDFARLLLEREAVAACRAMGSRERCRPSAHRLSAPMRASPRQAGASCDLPRGLEHMS